MFGQKLCRFVSKAAELIYLFICLSLSNTLYFVIIWLLYFILRKTFKVMKYCFCFCIWTSTPDPGIRKHTPRLTCPISAVWTPGCRYWFLVGHWDVVAYISSTEPATTSQCPTRNQYDIPESIRLRLDTPSAVCASYSRGPAYTSSFTVSLAIISSVLTYYKIFCSVSANLKKNPMTSKAFSVS